MFEQSPVCPICQTREILRIIYGYPVRTDYPTPWLYGGSEMEAESPTHFCTKCKNDWSFEGIDNLYFKFPSNCHFCGDEMSDTDKFTYQVEFDSWVEQHVEFFLLEHGTFSDDPFPVCGCCRTDIHVCQRELEQETEQDLVFRKKVPWIALASFVIFVLLSYLLTAIP